MLLGLIMKFRLPIPQPLIHLPCLLQERGNRVHGDHNLQPPVLRTCWYTGARLNACAALMDLPRRLITSYLSNWLRYRSYNLCSSTAWEELWSFIKCGIEMASPVKRCQRRPSCSEQLSRRQRR